MKRKSRKKQRGEIVDVFTCTETRVLLIEAQVKSPRENLAKTECSLNEVVIMQDE